MLEQVAHFNDLTPEMRTTLEERIKSFGKEVKYRFAISSENPDPEKFNGKIIWPSRYTLDPIVFDIVDNDEKRPNKSRAKKIAMIDLVDEKGIPKSFKRIRVHGKDSGVYKLDLGTPDEISQAMYIELHPKLSEGLFQDKKRVPIIFRVDEEKASKEARENRSAKAKASRIAYEMSDRQVIDFSAAMTWDETESIDILRNKVELLAEEDPAFFNDLVADKKIEYQSTIKRAITAGIIAFDPINGRFLWASNQQVITVLGLGDGTKNEVERLAEFLMTGGKKADDIYKKIESLLKS